VEDMLAGMSMSEYVHWLAIYEVEPFPEEREDMRTAELLRMMLVAAGAKKIPTIAEFIPDWWAERKPTQQTPAQIKANIQLIKAASKKRKK
jgi:hypothetical protein